MSWDNSWDNAYTGNVLTGGKKKAQTSSKPKREFGDMPPLVLFLFYFVVFGLFAGMLYYICKPANTEPQKQPTQVSALQRAIYANTEQPLEF